MREKDTSGGRKDIRSKTQNSKFLLQGWDVYVILFDKKNVCTEIFRLLNFVIREREKERMKRGEREKKKRNEKKSRASKDAR